MLAAAAAWEGLAAELGSMANAYDSVISGLTSEAWSGPSSASMAAAVAPYTAWMSSTAAQAEQTAVGARAAAAAYEAAFVATVPPPVIAANRSLLASLIATNLVGQNTPAIAATEAHYAEMWAQDAAAMYGYAGSAASASTVTPFTAPPQTTNPAGVGGQSVAVAQAGSTSAGATTQNTLAQVVSAVPQALQNFAPTAAPPSDLSSILNTLTGPLSPMSLFGIGGVPYLLGIQSVLLPMATQNNSVAYTKAMAAEGALAESPAAVGAGTPSAGATGAGPAVSATAGRAGMVGDLSVPKGWAAAAPAIRPTAVALPGAGLGAAPMAAADGESALFSELALGSMAGRAMGATGGAASRAVGAAAPTSPPTQATIIVIPPSADE